jgi:phosphoesterase RecJ-like protein
MGWWQSADSRINYSLRSKGNLDVGALAKKYGGGGHQNMAGFQVDLPIHIKLKA